MKAVFLCEDEATFRRVYADDVIDAIAALTRLDATVYRRRDLANDPAAFSDAAYLFSTWGMPTLSETEIQTYLPNLKCVFYAAGTVRQFAAPFLRCGVKVFSAWAANAVPVAEYTTAQIVLAGKGFFQAARLAGGGNYAQAKRQASLCSGNYGAKIGIIGAGMIGKRVIRLLKAYDFSVLVFDPFLPDDAARELGVQKTSLERLFRSCSVVSNHLADNAQTRGLLTYPLFSSMPRGAVFLNTGRGAQVVEADLCAALRERPDLTAVLDVTDPEPPPPDSPLFGLANCFLTPHIAGSSGDEVRRMSESMLAEFQAHLQNRPTRCEVTQEMLKTMA